VRSKADIDLSQLNLPHGNNTTKNWGKEQLKVKKRISSEVSVNSMENRWRVRPEEEKEGCDGKDLQKGKVLSLE